MVLTRLQADFDQVQDVQRKVGANIRRLRLDRGFTQDVFAERTGLNRSHMGEIERGESNITLQTLKLVADALKVRIRDLFEGV